MRHVLFIAGLLAFGGFLLLAFSDRGDAQANQWGTIKGRVIWNKAIAIPARKEIPVTVDPQHCLKDNPTADAKNGTILDEELLIDAKDRGIKNVFVYLVVKPGETIPIHPNLTKFPPALELDQPACMFFPRALAIREGQNVVVKNSAPVTHNIRWIGDGIENQGGNVTIKSGDKADIKDLKAQRLPLSLECNIHGWMKGRLAVVAHPYFAITDEHGNFEIKDAPVGDRKLMIYQETQGYRLGAKGKDGEPIAVKTGVNSLGELEMGK
jgi:hypothetical protein